VPAIALTGYGSDEDIRRCLAAGFTAHLTKPVNFSQLEVLIQRTAEAKAVGRAPLGVRPPFSAA